MTTFFRSWDNSQLDTASIDSSMLPPKGIYDLKNSVETVSTPLVKSVLSQTLDTKTFTIDFITLDPSGDEQKDLTRFFSKPGIYSITDTEYGLDDFEFYVLSLDSNFFEATEVFTITAQAKHPDFLEITRQNLYHAEKLAGESAGTINCSGTNSLGLRASLVVTITAATIGGWNTSSTVRISGTQTTGLTFNILDNYTYSTLVLDSYEEVLNGDAAVNPFDADFFQVANGQSGSWTITGIGNPLSPSQDYVIDIDFVAYRQAETL